MEDKSDQSLTVSVCAPIDSKSAESWTIFSIAPEWTEGENDKKKLI